MINPNKKQLTPIIQEYILNKYNRYKFVNTGDIVRHFSSKNIKINNKVSRYNLKKTKCTLYFSLASILFQYFSSLSKLLEKQR